MDGVFDETGSLRTLGTITVSARLSHGLEQPAPPAPPPATCTASSASASTPRSERTQPRPSAAAPSTSTAVPGAPRATPRSGQSLGRPQHAPGAEEEDDVEVANGIVSVDVLNWETAQLQQRVAELTAKGALVPLAYASRMQALEFRKEMIEIQVCWAQALEVEWGGSGRVAGVVRG